jgi:hypothetical protein
MKHRDVIIAAASSSSAQLQAKKISPAFRNLAQTSALVVGRQSQ